METDRTRFSPLPNRRRRLWPERDDETMSLGRDSQPSRADRRPPDEQARDESDDN